MAFADERELEEWFEEEKTAVVEKYQERREKGAASGAAKAAFDTEFKKLLRRYNDEFYTLESHQRRREEIRKPFVTIKRWFSDRTISFALWRKLKREQFKKWRFERQYRHLFKKV